jgi:hypothetical protein
MEKLLELIGKELHKEIDYEISIKFINDIIAELIDPNPK